ncbi:MAG TPA: glycosyltransferase family 9 protein [Ignavibacteriaceae bacterium]|jgi:ADP-heptose:LPS heptosyltransferase|nr:glycosyltransferase family 9 protein [Ignavibacteriaceae bacterium]
MITPKNLLIVRTDRIGDVVLSLPVVQFVKKHFPDCKITFLLREYTKRLALNNPYIDELLVLKEKDGKPLLWDNIKQLKEKKFDTSIVVYPTFIISLIMYLSAIRNRVGTGYRWYSLLFNQKVYEHRKTAERHELEYNIRLLQVFGIDNPFNNTDVEFHLSEDEVSSLSVEKVLRENKIDNSKPVIIVHPGSGGSAVDLPVASFKELINLLSTLDVQIVLTGDRRERAICEELQVNSSVKNLAGEFNLGELISLIKRADIFVSNSTGPLHIAAALNKHVVAFFPKILACSSKRWGPYTENKSIYVPQIDCSNCTREQCESLNCMNSINIDEVFANIKKYFKLPETNGEINAKKV